VNKATWVLILGLAFAICGCEFEDDSSGREGNISEGMKYAEITTTIIGKGVSPYEGGLYMYEGSGNKKIVVTSQTTILRQRDSCSGWDNAPVDGLGIGDVATVSYNKSDSFYEYSNQVIFANRIESHRAECVGGETTDGEDCIPCEFVQEALR
jgi:hypothetical protein